MATGIKGLVDASSGIQIPDADLRYTLANGISGYGVVTNPSLSGQNIIQPTLASIVPLTIQGFTNQTANLEEWKNSSGTVLASISANGALTLASISGTNGNIVTHDANGKLLDSGTNIADVLTTKYAFDNPGILMPLYIYPSDAYTNTDYNTVIDLKKKYHEVPLVTILNDQNGHITGTDGNYTAVIKRLNSAGAITIGYIATNYGLSGSNEVKSWIDGWVSYYPDIQGIFFDEMDFNISGAPYYSDLTQYAKGKGLKLTIGNPGRSVTAAMLNTNCVDNITVYETDSYPSESDLKGDFLDGYCDSHYRSRSAIVHSVAYNYNTLTMMKKYCGLIYATDDLYSPNPWDTLPTYLESTFKLLAKKEMEGIFTDTYFTTGLLPSNLLNPSFDTSSKIVSLSASSGTIDLYIAGQKFQKTSPQTVDLISIWTDNTLMFVYFNSSGVLSAMNTPWEINSNAAPVATIFWNGTSTVPVIGNEFHNATRNLAWHKWAHETIGTRYKSGLECAFTTGLSIISGGVIEDEDIVLTIPSQSSMRIWYRNSLTNITYNDNPSTTSAYIDGGSLKYDLGGTLTSVTDGYYIRNFVYANNDINYPIACIIGQNEYSNVNDARNCPFPNQPTYISNETKLLYTTIWKNIGGTPTFVEATDYRTSPTQPNGALSIKPIFFNELVDIDAPNPGLNEVLAWNGTAWTHISPKQDALPAGTTTTVLHGNELGSPSYSAVVEADISLSNIPTNNVSSAKHGFAPKLSDDPSQFLNGQGNWTTPAGIANAYISQDFDVAISASVNHGFGAYPIVQVISGNGEVFIPSSIIHNSTSEFIVNFSTTSSGKILATVGSPQLVELLIVTDNYTTTINDYFIEETSASKIITLHSPASLPKQRLVITNASTGIMDISGSINGTIQSINLPTTNSLSIYSNSATWRVY